MNDAAASKSHQILVVDSDEAFLRKLANEPQQGAFGLALSSSAAQASAWLAEPGRSIVAVFISAALPSMSWLTAIETAHLHRAAVPIFLLYDAPIDFSASQLEQIGVRKCLEKPVGIRKMIELAGPRSSGFDIDDALKRAEAARDGRDASHSVEQDSFVGIRADNFLFGSQSLFDVYVRVASGNFLKILNAGDTFELERLRSYLKKGVTHFYIRHEVQEVYVQYCEHLTRQILRHDSVPVNVKVTQTLNMGEATMGFLRQCGVRDAELRYASSFVQNVQQLFKQFKPENHGILQQFMSDIATYDHGVSATMLASLMCASVHIEDQKAVQIVGISALLHDIGLLELDESLRHEDESRMSESEIAVYRFHPEKGAEMLREIAEIKAAIPAAVALHHVRRGGRGFPAKVKPGSLNQVAEIVGITDEFSRLIERWKENPEFDPLGAMYSSVFAGFSKPIVQVFQRTFMLSGSGSSAA